MNKYLPIHRGISAILVIIAISFLAASLKVGGFAAVVFQVSIIFFALFCDTPVAAKWIKDNILDVLHIEDMVFFNTLVVGGLFLLTRHNPTTMLPAFFVGMWACHWVCTNAITLHKEEFLAGREVDPSKKRSRVYHDMYLFYCFCEQALTSCWTPFLGLIALFAPVLPNSISIPLSAIIFFVSYKEITGTLDHLEENLPYGIHTNLEDVRRTARLDERESSAE